MHDRRRKFELWARIAGAAVVFAACAVLVALGSRAIRLRNELARQSSSPEIVTAVDPALIRYREARRIETGFREARGIAVAEDGSLYAVGDNSVVLFDATGKRRDSQPQDEAPACVAIAGDGSLLIGARRSVSIIAKDGKPIARWKAPGRQPHLTSLAVSEHDVWVADAGQRVVYHYHRSGQLLGRLGKKDEQRGVAGLVVPSPHLDAAVAKDGAVWVANPGRHRMERYAKDGRLLSSWGKADMNVEGFSGCCNPTDFALLPDGRIVTAEKGLKRVKVYQANGTLDAVVAGPDTFSKRDGALDVAADGQGRIYVLDRGDGAVHVFARK